MDMLLKPGGVSRVPILLRVASGIYIAMDHEGSPACSLRPKLFLAINGGAQWRGQRGFQAVDGGCYLLGYIAWYTVQSTALKDKSLLNL